MQGQMSLFDIHPKDEKPRPCDYKFKRYIGQKVRYSGNAADQGKCIHVITAFEQYYTVLDDGEWIGTPYNIYPVEEE